MEIRATLLQEHSRQNAENVMTAVIQDEDLLSELIALIKSDDVLLAQRAAWPIGLLGTEHYALLKPYVAELITCLDKPLHPAISRNVYRVLQFIEVPEEHEGELFEYCARDLLDPKIPVAIKVFCMTVAYNICKKHSELKPELRLLIEQGLDQATAGYLSRSKKILKHL